MQETVWNVFIADDEPKIRRRLARIVTSIGEQYHISGEASDGEEALERVHATQPDILLVDICMPRIDGLRFIEQLAEDAQSCVVIVVSGHDEFCYARRAVELPVFDYLLKPVEPVHLQTVLARAVTELETRASRNRLLQWANDEVARNRADLIQRLFDDWLNGELLPSEVEIRKRVLPLSTLSDVVVVAVRMRPHLPLYTTEDRKEHAQRRMELIRLVSEQVSGTGNGSNVVTFTDRFQNLFVMVFGRGVPSEAATAIRHTVLERLNRSVHVEIGRFRLDFQGFITDYEAISTALSRINHADTVVGRVLEYLDANYHRKELTLESAATTLGFSPPYLTRLLKQYTGYTFSEYTNRYRVQRAIQLLHDPHYMVYEVAEAVGYTSNHYFSRVFKRITGRSPILYRSGAEEVR